MTEKDLYNRMFYKAVSKVLGPEVIRVNYLFKEEDVLIFMKNETLEEMSKGKKIGLRSRYSYIVCSELLGDKLWEELTKEIEGMSRTLSLGNEERITYQILGE